MNAVDEARGLLVKRLGDLDNERDRIDGALKELDGGKPSKKVPGRPRKANAKGKAKGKPRAKRGGKTRANEAVKLIEKKPGISASDIAKTMKIKPNYLYRVLGDLEKEGRVKKDGRNYFPVGK
jgi:hypothetical protein